MYKKENISTIGMQKSPPSRCCSSQQKRLCFDELMTNTFVPQPRSALNLDSKSNDASTLKDLECSCACCCRNPSQSAIQTMPQISEQDKKACEEEYKKRMNNLQMENLVKDQYCPGAIQSTIDCAEDFNELSFRLVFGCEALPQTTPSVEPITLLEAFCKRIELERQLLQGQDAYMRQANNAPMSSNDQSEELPYIDDLFRSKCQTELNASIMQLLKAEKLAEMNDPQLLISEPPYTSIYKATPPVAINNVEIVAYAGTTKPASDAPPMSENKEIINDDQPDAV